MWNAVAASRRPGGRLVRWAAAGRGLATRVLSDADRAQALRELSAKYASPFLWEEVGRDRCGERAAQRPSTP